MLFPESWLRSVVNPSVSTEELSHLLTMAGLEIEDVLPVAPEFSGVVVARVEEVSPHPDADRLRICRVNNGKEILQIVCGAPNVAAGLFVPLAQIGARLPGGVKISKGKLRGVESFGMLCSATEIGLTQTHDGLLILDPERVQLGQDIRDVFQLDEAIFELKITPNRADCLSIKGVAREVSALTGEAVQPFDFSPVLPTITDTLPVQIKAPELCGRFLGRIIRNVDASVPTPEWIKTRLERAGQRSVSVLVDLSNYVMLELGTPSHIFDLDRLPTPEIVVDWGVSGQKLSLLNGEEVELDEKVGIVYSGQTPEAMAGVMGGSDTAVSDRTTQIFIEQAFWYPDAIAGLTRRFKLNSEAAHRFERGVDFACLRDHLEYLTRLIVQVCGGEVAPIIELTPNLPKRESVKMRVARCHQILGIKIPVERMGAIFTALQFEHRFDGQVFEVVPPSWRFDIEIEEDLIEEVARVYGFDHIPAQPPVVQAVMLPANECIRRPHALRQILVDQDYQEVINFSFVPEQWEKDFATRADTTAIKLLNPIASQLSVMRSNLIAGLVDNIAYNAKRKLNRVRVFELGAVFRRDEQVQAGDLTVQGIDQPLHLAGAAWGLAEPEQWGLPARVVDFFDVKADVCALFPNGGEGLRFEARPLPALHPGRSAVIYYQGVEVGYMGELHPSLLPTYDLSTAPIVFELAYAALEHLPLPAPEVFSKQPVVIRDLAVWAPLALPVQALLDTLTQAKDPELKLIQDITLFDIWRDPIQPTERSLAFRLVLQDSDHTLEDAQVEQCMSKVLELWTVAHGVRQR